MKIYVSHSAGAEAMATNYIEAIRTAGADVRSDHASDCLASDAVLLFVSGTDHGDLKQDLNLALDNKKPVACVMEDGAVIDKGLEMQLGLAKKITSPSEIAPWIASLEKEKKKKAGKTGLIVAVVVILVLAFAGFGIKMSRDKAAAAEQQRIEQEQADLLARQEAEANDPINLYFDGKDPASFTELDLSGRGITDISFIADAVNLERLDLSDNDITDINVLLSLKKLKYLNISGNKIEDTSALEFMSNVEIVK